MVTTHIQDTRKLSGVTVTCEMCKISYEEPSLDVAMDQALEHELKTGELFGASFAHGVSIEG